MIQADPGSFTQVWDAGFKIVTAFLNLGALLLLFGIFRQIGNYQEWRRNIDQELSEVTKETKGQSTILGEVKNAVSRIEGMLFVQRPQIPPAEQKPRLVDKK